MSRAARIESVRAVGIAVTDQDRAVAFYVDTLGFEKVMDATVPELGGRWIEVSMPGSGPAIALLPAHADLPAGVDTGVRFTTEDAPALHADLMARGVDADELLLWDGVPPMFDFRDPDGNVLYVSEIQS